MAIVTKVIIGKNTCWATEKPEWSSNFTSLTAEDSDIELVTLALLAHRYKELRNYGSKKELRNYGSKRLECCQHSLKF